MIEKLKAYGEACKSLILYVLTPIAFVLGYIYYLIHKEQILEEELRETKSEKEMAGEKEKQEELDNDADHAHDDYAALREEYLRRFGVPKSDSSSGQGDSGPKSPDTHTGSGTRPNADNTSG